MDKGERLGKTEAEYRYSYFLPDRTYKGRVVKWRLRRSADTAIYDKLKHICMSMKAEDYIPLPQKINNLVWVELPDTAMRKYIKLEEQLAVSVEGSQITVENFAVLGGKLLQMANGAVYDEDNDICHIHDAKLEALEDIIEEANGKPVLVFYYYKHDLERLKKFLEGRDYRVLKSEQDIDDWNRGETPVMLLNPASAGHGLNLQFVNIYPYITAQTAILYYAVIGAY
jgi:SNF2 family DNA or RNA helicase